MREIACMIFRKGNVRWPCEIQCETCVIRYGPADLQPLTARTWPG